MNRNTGYIIICIRRPHRILVRKASRSIITCAMIKHIVHLFLKGTRKCSRVTVCATRCTFHRPQAINQSVVSVHACIHNLRTSRPCRRCNIQRVHIYARSINCYRFSSIGCNFIFRLIQIYFHIPSFFVNHNSVMHILFIRINRNASGKFDIFMIFIFCS